MRFTESKVNGTVHQLLETLDNELYNGIVRPNYAGFYSSAVRRFIRAAIQFIPVRYRRWRRRR